MKFLSLLGQHLKSDGVIEVLEHFGMPVVYEFDRLHEGTADLYWSDAKAKGFQLRFDEQQRLDTIFLYVMPRHGFSAVDLSNSDVEMHATLDDAHQRVKQTAHAVKVGDGYVKALFGDKWVHYEYRDGCLSLITLMLEKQ